MTSASPSLSQQPSTPSLQIIRRGPTQEEGKTSINDLNLGVATNTDNANTNFVTNSASLEGQEGNQINNVDGEKIARQTVASFGGTTPGSFQFRSASQPTSDGTQQTTLNLANDPNGHIRVMTVHSNDPGGQGTVSGLSAAAALAISSAVTTQASQVMPTSDVVENNGGSAVAVTVDNADGTKYTYYPAVQTADASSGAGQFYVMMSPQDMIPNVSGANQQRIIAPRGHSISTIGDAATFAVEAESIPVEFRKVDTPSRSARDERRRATHNEVERKRRTKINSWIEKLAFMVPECKQDQTKTGQSKGTTLSKTIDYIDKLRTQNERLTDTLKDHDRLIVENQVLRQQMEELRRENALLRANIHMQQQEHAEINAESQQMETAQ